MSLIQCKDVSLGYEGKVIVKNINFEINNGDYLCIVGENGSGKSTLMKTILQLHNPFGGEIISDVKQIGYLPQQTDIQKDFPAFVEEIVLSGCLCKHKGFGFYTKEDKSLVKENMEKMNITSLSKRCYRELSGGQQQRVLLARALCATKDILFLDEPVSGLDPSTTLAMYELIASLNKLGTAIVMVSHDMNAAITYSSHILHIGHDKPLFFGTTDKYKESSIGKKFLLNLEQGVDEND